MTTWTLRSRPIPLGTGRGVQPKGRRLLSFTLAVTALVLFLFAALEWTYGWFGPNGFRFNRGDLTIYTDATRRLFAGGPWFLASQTHGPYPIEYGHVLYPPVTSLFFAPWLVLPGWSFVLIPAAIVIASVVLWRPSPSGWCLIGLCLLWPSTGIKVLSANPSIWISAFVALGLRYRWPGSLILLKPSFLPLALIGIRDRRWWICAGALALLSMIWLGDTFLWVQVVRDSRNPDGLLYSWTDVPMVLVPLIAWVSGARRP